MGLASRSRAWRWSGARWHRPDHRPRLGGTIGPRRQSSSRAAARRRAGPAVPAARSSAPGTLSGMPPRPPTAALAAVLLPSWLAVVLRRLRGRDPGRRLRPDRPVHGRRPAAGRLPGPGGAAATAYEGGPRRTWTRVEAARRGARGRSPMTASTSSGSRARPGDRRDERHDDGDVRGRRPGPGSHARVLRGRRPEGPPHGEAADHRHDRRRQARAAAGRARSDGAGQTVVAWPADEPGTVLGPARGRPGRHEGGGAARSAGDSPRARHRRPEPVLESPTMSDRPDAWGRAAAPGGSSASQPSLERLPERARPLRHAGRPARRGALRPVGPRADASAPAPRRPLRPSRPGRPHRRRPPRRPAPRRRRPLRDADPSATSACRASRRSPAGSTPPATARGPGPCACSPASAPPRTPTPGSGSCSRTARPASPSPTTCPPCTATTPTTPRPTASSGRAAWRSAAWRTWRCCSTGCRSTGSAPR